MTDVLNKPFLFRSGHCAKNRAVVAPMTNMQSPSSSLSEEEFRWLNSRIEGGFGTVSTCASHITAAAKAWPGEFGNYGDEHIPGLKRLADAGRNKHALVIPQLFHGGFRSPSRLTGVQPVSASACEIKVPDFEVPRALTADEILLIEQEFVKASVRSVQAGLPGVEIHGANGYLFTQFLSPFTNKRTDEWGGTLANRARFLLQTVGEVRRAIGKNSLLGVRLSPENTKLISEIDIDEMKDVAFELHRLGVDYISLSLWDACKVADKYEGHSSQQTVVEQFRNSIPSATAIIASGKIWTKMDARRVLDLGADFVALGAAAITNPTWPMLESDKQVTRLPLSVAALKERSLSAPFIEYLRQWKFVTEGDQ